MDGTCSTYVRKTEYSHEIVMVKPEGRDHLRDLGIDGRITLEWILKNNKL